MEAENGYILQMKNICKSFPGVKALDHVDLNLKPGEVLALCGENGAGKSTLMKVLAGLYQPDEGEIPRVTPPALTTPEDEYRGAANRSEADGGDCTGDCPWCAYSDFG